MTALSTRLHWPIGHYLSKDGREARADLRDIADALRHCEKFEIPCPTFTKSEIDEVCATMDVLAEHGVLRLPYENVYVELVMDPARTMLGEEEANTYMQVNTAVAPGQSWVRMGFWLGQGPDWKDKPDPILIRETTLREPFVESEVMPSLRPMVKGLYPLRCVAFMCSAVPGSKGFKGWDDPVIFQPVPGTMAATGAEQVHPSHAHIWRWMCFYCTAWFLFLLCAKGTSRAVYAAPDRLNKARLKNRQEPIDGFTKVLLPGFIKRRAENNLTEAEERQHGNDGRKVTERKRPRLHWRRGHMKGVRYGEGRRLTKPMFIAPTMVGYEEEGRIFHLQYGQELSSANLAEAVK